MMSSKVASDMIGRCGLYCGACPVYLSRFEDEDFRNKVVEAWKISAERCDCEGCGKPKPQSPCADCKILICLDSKNLRTCYECSSFDKEDCEVFEQTYRICLEQSVDLRQKIPWGFAQCQRCGRELF